MRDVLVRRVAAEVQRGFRSRSRFYESSDLEDEQQLGPPAGEAEIRELEERIGHSLPPSYRAFLLMHNGWQMVSATTDLLSVGDMLRGPIHDRVMRWQQRAAQSGNALAGKGLVIGYSKLTQTRVILDPDDVVDGEWRLIEMYKDEEVEYSSFLEWLEKSSQDFDSIVNNPLREDEDV